MDRAEYPNPHMQGRTVQQLRHPHSQLGQWETTIPRQVPPGFQSYARWINETTLEMGIEPIPTPVGAAPAKPVKGDGLDSMTLADVQSVAGREGVTYEPRTIKADLIAKVRAKRIEKKDTEK